MLHTPTRLTLSAPFLSECRNKDRGFVATQAEASEHQKPRARSREWRRVRSHGEGEAAKERLAHAPPSVQARRIA
jgi:hypothetical protein